MARLRMQISISLDGFVAGPDQSADDPLGRGGTELHRWAVPLQVFQSIHGREGGEVGVDNDVLAEAFAGAGASIMGRNMFGGQPGGWSVDDPWNGWWGDEPPFHHPVFVITHHEREPLTLGETTFNFVTDGIQSALDQAMAAAGGQDVGLGGGCATGRQYLAAGLVDEVELHQVPVLLGAGERLFDGAADYLAEFELTRTIGSPGVTHLRFERA